LTTDVNRFRSIVMLDEVKIRPAEECDRDLIIKLQNEVFGKQQRSTVMRDIHTWDWKYERNPFGKTQLTVAEYKHEIVGVDNLWPWELRYRGETLKALQPCDTAVSQQFRGVGIFKKMRLFGIEQAAEKNVKLLFNFPNENSLQGNLSLGSVYLGRVNWRVKILKPVGILKGLLFENKSEPYEITEEFRINVDLLETLSEKFQSHDEYLKINRIEGFHKWRFSDRPNRSYGMVYYSNNGNDSAAIFTVNQKGNSREMVVVDILGSTGDTLNLFKLVKKAAIRADADFIAVMDNPQFNTKELWKNGYLKKKLKNMVVLPIDLSLEQIITSYSNWSLMAAMHDSI